MLVLFIKSPLPVKLAYGVGTKAEVKDVLGRELVRDGYATDVTPPKTKESKAEQIEAPTKATTKKKKFVAKTK